MLDQLYRKWLIPGFETGWKRRKTFHYWSALEQSQWLAPDELQAYQVGNLRNLLAYCEQNSPYYQQQWKARKLRAQDISTVEDLQRLPIMTRATMRDQAALICPSNFVHDAVFKSTGGSSGMPLRFSIDADSNDRRVAASFRGYGWAGAAPGTKQCHLWGVPLGKRTLFSRCKEHLYSRLLYRREILNTFDYTTQSAEYFVSRINRHRPRNLVAYTSPLAMLARDIEDRGLRVHQPESIIVGAEKLHPFQRRQIERTFGAPVFETYGSREFTLIGAECEFHTGLHITSELLIVEVVDGQGQPVADGEEGDVLVTDLFNRATPFVRYKLGDRAIAGFDYCRCGRGLPVLRSVAGRELDILQMADGRHLPGEFFPHLLKDVPAIREFRVVQQRCNTVNLELVVNGQWNEGVEATLRSTITRQLGPATDLQIVLRDQLQLTPSGKRQVVVRC